MLVPGKLYRLRPYTNKWGGRDPYAFLHNNKPLFLRGGDILMFIGQDTTYNMDNWFLALTFLDKNGNIVVRKERAQGGLELEVTYEEIC